ncbi:MAG: (2Fe-2S)-binding protein [Acidobacteria bacterium]|nr:MAG: (2Fe-2S)-binding protein [Acidobacteriota bacterium]
MPKVNFIREKKVIEVPVGSNLRKVALANGIEVYPGFYKVVNCRGNATCGSCRMVIMKGTIANTASRTFRERLRFKLSYLNIGEEEEMRLSCQTTINGDLEVYTKPAFNWYGKPDKLPVAST